MTTHSTGTTVVGAIDIGSNSTNLLIVEARPSGVHAIERVITTTRLAAGLDRSGSLSPEAMTRTIDTISDYMAILRRHGAPRTRIVASSACRDSANGSDFIDRVNELTGLTVEILSAHDEGMLAYRGAMSGLRPDPMGNLVIDIGGGSTEFVLDGSSTDIDHGGGSTEFVLDGSSTDIDHGGGSTEFVLDGSSLPSVVLSIPVGAVRITDRHLTSDPPRPEDLSNAVGEVSDLVDDLVHQFPALVGRRQVVGVAGTIDTVAAVEIGDETVPRHGFVLTRAAAEDVFRTLATEPLRDRVHNPGLPADRADVIVGGCCVLVAVMRRLRIDEIVVSTRDLLDGVCEAMIHDDTMRQTNSGEVRP